MDNKQDRFFTVPSWSTEKPTVKGTYVMRRGGSFWLLYVNGLGMWSINGGETCSDSKFEPGADYLGPLETA